MPRVTLGVILGLSIGIADVLLMLPLSFPDKRKALLAAFSSRFSLGFFAATIDLPTDGRARKCHTEMSNTNNMISDDLTLAEKRVIAAQARASYAESRWEHTLW